MARLTGFRYGVGADEFEQLGPYAKAALAFGTASDVIANGGREAEVADLLAAAIKFAPKEPTNYYFEPSGTQANGFVMKSQVKMTR